MAATPEETIRAAAEAYIAGDEKALSDLMDDDVRVLGSEQRDIWHGRHQALQRLGSELKRRRTIANSVSGSLIDSIAALDSAYQGGELAWWSGSGDLNVDGTYHRETSWTVVLSRCDEDDGTDWKIVHSHFSIHR